jgi:hypothetical protein
MVTEYVCKQLWRLCFLPARHEEARCCGCCYFAEQLSRGYERYPKCQNPEVRLFQQAVCGQQRPELSSLRKQLTAPQNPRKTCIFALEIRQMCFLNPTLKLSASLSSTETVYTNKKRISKRNRPGEAKSKFLWTRALMQGTKDWQPSCSVSESFGPKRSSPLGLD